MTTEIQPLYLGGRPHRTGEALPVVDKFTGESIGSVALADAPTIDRAIGLAVKAGTPMARLAAYERRDILSRCVRRFEEGAAGLAATLCREGGKPIRDARTEVTRLIDTFRAAAEESTRIGGEVLPLDLSPRARAYSGMWKRVPLGPCSFIAPFNFPLNLAAHKIAPAIAAGCPFILKPASFTPLSALAIGAVLSDCGLPDGAFSILPCRREAADLFATDERLRLLSFTGSPEVGWALKAKAGKKRVVLELGGNAAVVVDADSDLDDAADRILIGTFGQSGQSCIGVQRILVQRSVYGSFRDRLVARTRALRSGDPEDEATAVGPLITEGDAVRLERWIREAVENGATILTGGGRRRSVLEPTLLEDVPKDQPLWCREAFGPVGALAPFDTFEDALREVNDSAYGLQAGIFTRDLRKALRAWDELEVGGVVIGDVPSFRVDHMPYGGVKDSGLGREGVRFAIEDMTEIRMLVIRNPEGL